MEDVQHLEVGGLRHEGAGLDEARERWVVVADVHVNELDTGHIPLPCEAEIGGRIATRVAQFAVGQEARLGHASTTHIRHQAHAPHVRCGMSHVAGGGRSSHLRLKGAFMHQSHSRFKRRSPGIFVLNICSSSLDRSVPFT